jgi:hypothetical protein
MQLERKELIERLESESKNGTEEVLLAAGWSIIKDHLGRWPGTNFKTAFMLFKMGRTDAIFDLAGRLGQEGDLRNLLAMSLSCPEIVNNDIRTRLEEAYQKGVFEDILPACTAGTGNHFRAAQLIGSYFSAEKNVPWTTHDQGKIQEIMYGILSRELERHLRRAQIPEDVTYYEAKELDESSNNAFRNSALIGWKAMPSDSMRLNIELFEEGLGEKLRRLASMLGNMISYGYTVSAKFTTSDVGVPGSIGERAVLYVPTCALAPTMGEYKDAGLNEGILNGTDASEGSGFGTHILLPEYCSVRTSREGCGYSTVQGLEAAKYASSQKLTHRIVRLNRYVDVEENEVSFSDGSRLDLFKPSG